MAPGTRTRAQLANNAKPYRAVVVFFHTDRYTGNTCKLIPVNPKPGQPASYTSEAVKEVIPKKKWAAPFLDLDIPKGAYYLEVSFKSGSETKTCVHRVRVNHAYKNLASMKNGKAVRFAGLKRPIQVEPLIGDGYSLEEAFIRQFNYRYASGLAKLISLASGKQVDGADASTTGEAFKTMVGVTKALHDRMSAVVGWVKLDNDYFSAMENVWQLYKDPPWKDAKEVVESLPGDSPTDDEFKTLAQKFGVDEWQSKVDKYTTPLAWVDRALKAYSVLDSTSGLFESFHKAQDAEGRFFDKAKQYYSGRGGLNPSVDWFSREEVMSLENLRMAADNLAGDAQVKGAEWTFEMVGLGLGLFFPGGFLVSLGKTAERIGQAVSVVKFGLDQFEGAVYGDPNTAGYFGRHINLVKEWWHDLNAQVNNNVQMFHRAFGNQYPVNQYILQFHYRTKVLYGLMDLIDRCGSYEDDSSGFRQRVGSLKIKKYIDELVLGKEFWVRADHVHDDWVENYHLEADSTARSEVISLAGPGDGKSHWVKVEFQRYFPIHFTDHSDIEKFAIAFSSDSSQVKDEDIATSFFQVAKSVKIGADDKNRRVVIPTSWKTVRSYADVDSETPARVVIVLKKDTSVRVGTPANVQIGRVDGVNAWGPNYQGVIKRLTERDKLPASIRDTTTGNTVKVNGCRGAVIPLGYQYTWKNHEPMKIYQGFKPMKGWWHSTIPTRQHVSGYWYVGRNAEAKNWVDNGASLSLTIWNQGPTEIKDSKFDTRNVDKFSDGDFLKRSTEQEKHKRTVEKSHVKTHLQFQVGGQWKSAAGYSACEVGVPTRVVIEVEKKSHYVPGTPSSVIVTRNDGFNVTGPTYRASQLVNLSPYGFSGKWGAVIPLWFYYIDLNKTGSDQVKRVHGIKPICNKSKYDAARGEMANSSVFDGFTFDLKVTVGDSWSSPMTVEPDNFKLKVTDFGKYASVNGLYRRFIVSDDHSEMKAILSSTSSSHAWYSKNAKELAESLAKDYQLHPDVIKDLTS